MTRKQFKLYKQTKGEIALLNEEINQLEYELQDLCDGDDVREINKTTKTIALKLKKKYDLISYRNKLLLPTHLVLKDGLKECKDFLQDNKEMEMDLETTIEEYSSMYLLDEYNHNHYGFQWAIKDNCDDIFLTRIRWFENQLIKEDLKDILKGKIKSFKNRFVSIHKHAIFKNALTIENKESGFFYMANYKKAINYLERIKAL